MSALIATRPLPREPHAADTGDRGRTWLARLFADDFSFPSISVCPLPPGDRSPAEHDAASRAAGCRDLFVIHADPVAGERVIADLVRASTDRVLILTPDPTTADRLTERLLRCGVPALRALADDENPFRSSAAVSKATSAAIGGSRVEQAKREAAAAIAAAEQRLAAFGVVAKAVARLVEVNELLKRLDAEVAEQAARRDRIERELANEVDTPFAATLAKLKTDHDHASSRLSAELQTLTARHEEDEEALALARQQHADASRKPGFFGRIFGAKPKPGLPDPADLESQIHALESEVAALEKHSAELRARAESLEAAGNAEREKAIATELAARRSASEAALATIEDERSRARAEAAALNKVIAAAVPGEDHATAERQLAAARERAAEVARSAPDTMARAIAEPRVVVGTPRCLDNDPVFAALSDDPPFGLLVLDRAEELPEPAFPRLARCAERWVLIGDAIPHGEPRAPTNGTPRPARNGRSTEVPFLARLAKWLDRQTWAAEGDRLVCRLTHLTRDQRRGMTREPLADRPEIELRVTAPDGKPLLAEIAFPGTTAVHDAKSFLFHELGEVLLRPCGELVWTHSADAITAHWPTADSPTGVWLDLEPGVREKVVGVGLFAFTAAVSFDPAAGWDAEKAAAWLAKHLAPCAGRFAALPRSVGTRPVG